jgi:hypothetical protein
MLADLRLGFGNSPQLDIAGFIADLGACDGAIHGGLSQEVDSF